jgi:hypothetical protein
LVCKFGANLQGVCSLISVGIYHIDNASTQRGITSHYGHSMWFESIAYLFQHTVAALYSGYNIRLLHSAI